MSQTPMENVVTHWHKLFENFQTSAKDFYTTVELALDARKIPGLRTTRVKWSEGGLLSPDREYLRVEGDRHAFDICAAPFGTGYFFSSWVTRRKARFVAAYLLSFFVLTLIISWVLKSLLGLISQGLGGLAFGFGASISFVLLPLAFLIVLWLIAVASHAGSSDPEAAILAVPLIGWLYEKMFARETYYRIDTMLMFQSAVHSAMLEVIDGQTTQKGLRCMSEDERKPVFQKLM